MRLLLYSVLTCFLASCGSKSNPPPRTPSTGKATVRLERTQAAVTRAQEATERAGKRLDETTPLFGRNAAKAVLILEALRKRRGGKIE